VLEERRPGGYRPPPLRVQGGGIGAASDTAPQRLALPLCPKCQTGVPPLGVATEEAGSTGRDANVSVRRIARNIHRPKVLSG
jgi:hypothetical protein